MPLYALRVSLSHLSFRIPELLSISQLFGFEIKFVSSDKFRSVLVVELEKDEHVERILDRGMMVMSAIKLYASGGSYEELHADLRAHKEYLEPHMDQSWKITFESINHNVTEKRQRETIDTFEWTGLRGPIRLKNPEVEFVIYEDYTFLTEGTHDRDFRLRRDGNFDRVYFGSRIGFGRARPLLNTHSVKTRAYYGNTSMDAEMGFIMTSQTLAAPGKIIYDPFVGTGSLLYAAAHWGAYVIGSDIDGRQIRGKAKGKETVPGVFRAAEQYGVSNQFLDCLVYDVTQSPLRRGGWIDAIITDPPYGVRAGAKRTGKGKSHKKPLLEEPHLLPDGTYSHTREDYVPPFRPYELTNLMLDLILLARYLLVPKGRLVFFLPTVTEEYEAIDIPVVEGMRELKVGEGSVENFGKWGRRLITMEKTATDDGPPPTFEDHPDYADFEKSQERAPGHYQFRDRYFESFKPRVGKVADEVREESEASSASQGPA
ncbi:hypothetical protein EHS25_006796 [Saitozyma podzolica]|uniref:tRNA (guanine(10)-N(2))-methyltransferase n=1 Tax=Saitozyma podzolica TaxID=1890683 RepID=A0A427XRH5_9TREE|nr:hypothetical protein EHS25_006796 [Saitozyma podzolica]